MHFHIVTLFPEIIHAYTGASIIHRACLAGLLTVSVYNPRDYAKNVHKKVDDAPYGGGPGMVMMVQPIVDTVSHIRKTIKKNRKGKEKVTTLLFSPGGKQFTNKNADVFRKRYSDIILIAGRYEGVDARVRTILRAQEVSIGPFVLSGGEIPALTVLDAVTRLIPGALGNIDSVEESRNASHDVFTRPEKYEHDGKTYRVPRVLLEGNHRAIEEWRKNH